MPELEIELTNLYAKSRGGENIKVSKTSISIHIETVKKLGWKEGDYIMTGIAGSAMFIGKRPKNMFGGHRLTKLKSANITRMQLSVTPKITKFLEGEFKITKTLTQQVINQNDEKVSMTFHQLEPV